MDKSKKIVKPTLTTHNNLIGQLFYIHINQVIDEISTNLKLDDKTKEKLKNHIMKKSNTLFTYKIFNKYHNILK